MAVLGGDLPGLGVTETAHHQGAEVTLIESGPAFGYSLGLPGRWRVVNDLGQAGVNLVTGAEVTAITDRRRGVAHQRHRAGHPRRSGGGDLGAGRRHVVGRRAADRGR